MKIIRTGVAAALMMSATGLSATGAWAKWHEASSEHFVVYADDSAADIQRFAEQLERYHKAMDYVIAGDYPKPSPSNRVTVYVVRDEAEVRRLAGKDSSRWLSGFYVPRAGGSISIIPKVNAARGDTNEKMLTLLHEYAHHFILGSLPTGLPRWLSEGAAEFYASAKFETDGSVSIGLPAYHRGYELYNARDVTVRDLLDPDSYEKRKRDNIYDAFYGKSWLLYHYLTFEPTRKGQLLTYQRKLIEGMSLVEAGRQAFGDFDMLEKELDRYLSKRLSAYKLKAEYVAPGAVAVRALRDGEAAIMPVRIRSKRGVNRETAQPVLVDARAVAARYPSDPSVLAALAEAEYDAGHDKEAIAAADKAIAGDPKEVNAYVQKGFALFRIAENADDKAVAYREARKPFVALNKLENDHPLPLIYYYRSYAEQGKPPELAVRGLEQAVGLAPFDMGLRFQLARQYIRDQKLKEARLMLQPVAYNPHGGGLTKLAQALIGKIDAGTVSAADASGDVVIDEGDEPAGG